MIPHLTPGEARAFTTAYPVLINNPITEIEISDAFDANSATQHPPTLKVIGVWDTGASGSVISPAVVQKLNLSPTGKTKAGTAGGRVNDANTYIVHIFLPNKVVIPGVQVTELPVEGVDALIGMDIIGRGDFAITNSGGHTKLSYQIPSTHDVDFVKEMNSQNSPKKVGRNDPCPCGSQKKYKHCHGK